MIWSKKFKIIGIVSLLCLSLMGCTTNISDTNNADNDRNNVNKVDNPSNDTNPASIIVDAWNTNSIKEIASLLDDGMALHGPRPVGKAGFGGNKNGKAAFLIHQQQLRDLLGEDATVMLSHVIKEGELISATYEYTGVQARAYVGVAPNGQPLTVSVQDTYLMRDGKIVEAWHNPDRFSAIETITVLKKEIPSYANIQSEVVTGFEPGTFPESVVQHPNGEFFVTLQLQGQIWRISNGEASLFMQLPENAMTGNMAGPSTLTVDDQKRLVSVIISDNPEYQGVWAYDVESKASQKLASIPSRKNHLNGSAIDEQGRIYVADSTLGIIWQVVEGEEQARIWLEDSALATRKYVGLAPGVNGLRYFEGELYASVPDRQTIVRIPIREDGSPGEVSVHTEGLAGDDFAIDSDGTIYITTHVDNSVVQVAPDGKVLGTISTKQDGIIGSTAAIIAHDSEGKKWLYVTNDGGLLGPPGMDLKPNLSRLPLE